jgi:hypothetical protein
VLGASGGELDRVGQQTQRRTHIPRSFAIATKEVTVAQFQRFLDARPEIKRKYSCIEHYSPEPDGPALSVTWFEAAQYCNWLSQQEGIPPEQWCYPAIDKIEDGMELPKDYLQRTGYRLPTEAEWECTSRAGALTSRFYGSSEAPLKEYAWYAKTTNAERAWPTGQLKPNDLGLFDIYGNAYEWCQDRFREFRPDEIGQVHEDTEDRMLVVSSSEDRAVRGGSFVTQAARLDSVDRERAPPSSRSYPAGFRIAKTYR